MSTPADELAASIKFDVDRLANLKNIEESGILREPGQATSMVIVHRTLKNGHRRRHFAIHVSENHWHFWATDPDWPQSSVSFNRGPWSQFANSVLGFDSPIITKVEYHGQVDYHILHEEPSDG